MMNKLQSMVCRFSLVYFIGLYQLILDISKATSISTCDIIETLASLNMIRMLEKDKLIIYRSQVRLIIISMTIVFFVYLYRNYLMNTNKNRKQLILDRTLLIMIQNV